jgi:tetratricopeptide (TPR) repeat protein
MTNSFSPDVGRLRHAIQGLVIACTIAVVAPCSLAQENRYSQQLVGDDASIVDSLTQQIDIAESREEWQEALRLYREIHAVRLRVQGADHWETAAQWWAVRNAETKTRMQKQDASLYQAIATPLKFEELIDPIVSGMLRAQAIADLEVLVGTSDPTLGAARLELAQLLILSGDDIRGEDIASEALATFLLTLGPDHPQTADVMVSLGYIQLALGKPALTVQQMAEATRIRENALGPNHILTAEAHVGWGAALAPLGRHVDAHTHFATALPIVAATHGRLSAPMGVIYSEIGHSLDARGQLRDASQFHRVASEILFLADVDRQVGELVDHVFPRLMEGEEQQAACDSINTVLRLKLTVEQLKNPYDVRKTLSTAISKHAAHLDRFNTFLMAIQGPDGKLPVEHPLKTYKPLQPTPDTKLTRAAVRWAKNLSIQGRHREAELPCAYLLYQYGNRLRSDHYQAARVFQVLAEVLLNQGRTFDAYPHLREWRTQTEKADLPPLELLRARSAFAMGRSLVGQFGPTRDERRVVDEIDQVLHETAALGLTSNSDLVRRMVDRAAVLGLMGRAAESELQAASVFVDAIRIFGVESGDAADTCLILGQQQLKQGKALEAERSFRLAYQFHHSRLPAGRDGAVRAVTGLAESLYAQSRWQEAVTLIAAHEARYQTARSNTSNYNLSRAFHSALTEPLILRSLALARLKRFREAFTALEQTRSRAFYDAIVRGQVEAKARIGLVRRVAVEGKIFALLVRPVLSNEETNTLNTLRGERDLLDLEISKIYASEIPQPATIEQIQKALPFDAAIITWVDFVGRLGARDERWACILRAEGEPIWTQLRGSGPNGAWTRDDEEAELDLPRAIAETGTKEECDELAESVSKRRFEPLRPNLCGVRKLLVTADWLAKKIPAEIIAEGFEVSYIPSGTYLERSNKLPPPKGNRLLVFGDPHFPKEQSGDRPTRGLLVSNIEADGIAEAAQFRVGDVLLAYADTAVDSVEQLDQLISANSNSRYVTICCWRPQLPAPIEIELRTKTGRLGATFSAIESTAAKPQALPGFERMISGIGKSAGARPKTFLQKENASEQTLESLRAKGELRRFSHLFFTTHGAQHQFAMQTGLQFPLVDGATERPNSVGNIIDGELTASEVLNTWELDADLVTLAACGSGLGQSVADEGLLGFSQAFLLSGSRSVCITLCDVRELSTALLMDRFYSNLLPLPGSPPMSKSAALADAKNWLRALTREGATETLTKLFGEDAIDDLKTKLPNRLRPYEHPRFWAPFVLVGQP